MRADHHRRDLIALYDRLRAACCDESAIDPGRHALRVGAVVLQATAPAAAYGGGGRKSPDDHGR